MEDEKKIYAIVSGEYSNFAVHGYCESLDEAYRVIATHENYDWEVLELEHISAPKDVKVILVHNFSFASHRNRWVEYNYYSTPIKAKELSPPKVRAYYGNRYDAHGNRIPNGAEVGVELDTNNEEKARKIAQDALYKWLAEHYDL